MEIIKNKKIDYKGKVLGIESLDIDFGNGNIGTFERTFYIKRSGNTFISCMIIPLDQDNNIYLVKQFQAGSEKVEFVAPKGGINRDRIEETINQELQEEIGLKANKLEFIAKINPLPSYVELETDIYLATELTPSKMKGDELENTEITKMPFPKALELIFSGEITDARTIAAILLVKEIYINHS